MKYFVLTYKRKRLPTISTLLKCGIKREDIFIVHSTDDDSEYTFGNDIYFIKPIILTTIALSKSGRLKSRSTL